MFYFDLRLLLGLFRSLLVASSMFCGGRTASHPASDTLAYEYPSIQPSKTDNEHPSRKDDVIRSFIYLKLISRPGSWLVGIFDPYG